MSTDKRADDPVLEPDLDPSLDPAVTRALADAVIDGAERHATGADRPGVDASDAALAGAAPSSAAPSGAALSGAAPSGDPPAGDAPSGAEATFSEQIADQLGGVRGVIESCVPVLVFIGVNIATSLRPALIAAVAVAVAIGVFRLARRQPVRHAVNGLFGIALGGAIAWKTGQAKDFYLPGIFISAGYAAALLVSMAVRRPIIGYVWGIVMTRGRHDWRTSPRLMRTFQWLTLLWAGCFLLRGAVQAVLYLADQTTLLGVSRIALSWPLYVAQLAITLWAVRRAGRRADVAV